jgi:hypothetical protein
MGQLPKVGKLAAETTIVPASQQNDIINNRIENSNLNILQN